MVQAVSDFGKQVLRRSGVLRSLNQTLKARATKAFYKHISSYYGHQKLAVRQEDLLAGLTRLPMNPAILFMGTDHAQDTSGMLQALQRIGRVTAFTRADGLYGQSPSSGVTSLDVYEQNTTRLRELIGGMVAEGYPPHLIIGQMWGNAFDGAVLADARRRHGTMAVNICMDDRHTYWGNLTNKRWMGTYGMIPHIDLALTAAPECVTWYETENRAALFFPEASDPAIFHPMPSLPKLYDVCFIGARYGLREEVVLALRRAGISVSAFGNGWEGGRIPTQEAPRVFAQSRIVLGVGTIGHCRDFYSLKMRDFDAPMSGSCYLTHDNPDLHGLYVAGEEIVTYVKANDCVEHVRYLLAHEAERESIARRGHARALRDHTWDKRFSGMMSRIGPLTQAAM